MPDMIYIRDLTVKCIIGTTDRERRLKQAVCINIALETDLSRAGRSDRLEDTVNYKDLSDEITALVVESSFFLIERMADGIAAACLKERRVKAVTVTIDKPGAVPLMRSVAVRIHRIRGTTRRRRA